MTSGAASDRASVPAPVRADRAAGVVLASAAGDALGAGYEFGPALPADAVVHMAGGGTFDWAPGEWTDDTQMGLAILTPLAAGSTDIVADVEAGFRAWHASGPRDVGVQTSSVLRSGGPLAEVAARHAATHPDSSAGNGSLMRTGPIALAHPDKPEAVAALAREVSALTHADADCVDACVLWSVAIGRTIHHAPIDGGWWDPAQPLRDALVHLDEERRPRWRRLIEDAADGLPLEFGRNGWVVHAFQAALAAICSTPVPVDAPCTHLQLALDEAVRVGGDTDTVAAIAGAMLGARWGATAVPLRWRRLVHGRRTYAEEPLRAADLDRLARLAFRGGSTDPTGWPAVASMLPHYESTWPDDPRRVDVAGVSFGNVHALGDALDEGADAVVSLCRMGTDDVPATVEHHVVGLLDSTPDENPNLDVVLADVADTVATLVGEGRRVFVHCVQAQNRTPTVAAAWLVRHHGRTADEALATVAREMQMPKPFLADAVRRLNHVPPGPMGRGTDTQGDT